MGRHGGTADSEFQRRAVLEEGLQCTSGRGRKAAVPRDPCRVGSLLPVG